MSIEKISDKRRTSLLKTIENEIDSILSMNKEYFLDTIEGFIDSDIYDLKKNESIETGRLKLQKFGRFFILSIPVHCFIINRPKKKVIEINV